MADDFDLEEELLQVAGRSRAPATKKRGRGKRADDASSGELSSEEEGRGRSSKRKQPQSSKRSRGGKGASDEDDDEDDDGYGSDLYKDDDDREKLEAMTELEREMILADRAEERDKARQRKEILKKARDADKAEPRGQRLSSRQKKATADKDTAIRKIEAARKRQDKGSGKSKGRGRRSDDEDDDEDDDEEEYVESEAGSEGEEEEEGALGSEEGDRPGRRPPTRASAGAAGEEEEAREQEQAGRRAHAESQGEEALRGVRRQAYEGDDDMEVDEGRLGGADVHVDDDENADANEYRSIQLTRTQLEAMYDKPFFEGEGIAGALVRLAYGPSVLDEDGNMRPTNWVMQVVSIKDGTTSYPFGPRQTACFKQLEVKDGARRVITRPLSVISNQPFLDKEVERFIRHTVKMHDKPISKQQAADIKQRMQLAINYRWDSAKVKEMLARKRDAGTLPVNLPQEKSRLQRLLEGERAQPVVDLEKVAELEVKLKVLEEQFKKASGERRSGMSNINQRNKEANFSQTIRNVSNKPANAPARKAGGDPFSRRETRPNIYWNTTQKKEGEADPAATEAKAPGAAAGKLSGPASGTAPLKASMARLDPVELVKMLDLDIDVQPLQDCSIVPPLHMRLLGPRWHQSLTHHTKFDLSGRTLLTVQDWQSRAGG